MPFEPNTPYSPTPDNRPAALEHSPLAFTREGHSQMSFGERAALEGILAQLHPRLAIEIGTAEGGSLSRIADYSTEVHSIDLTHDELSVELPEYVALHAGPSERLLTGLLNEFAAAKRLVDFALVDGDHSFDGVANDLRVLLRSPATDRSVIVVHDSMNEEVRAGIESVGLDDYRKVIYYELDFVPGYMYRDGSVRHSVWGGLGLIVCDEHRSQAYYHSPRQRRYYEPYAAIHRMRAEILQSSDQDSLQDNSRTQGELGKELNAEHQQERIEHECARSEQLQRQITEMRADLERSRHELRSTSEALHQLRSSRLMRYTGMARRLYYRATGQA